MITRSCQFSFGDLYQARFGRHFSVQEKARLYALPQTERNNIVRRWAAEANWLSEDRVGLDGVVYTAFWKEKN